MRERDQGMNHVFSVPFAVAQSCTLPYRRFAIGSGSASFRALELAEPLRNAIPRYGRLRICATLNKYPGENSPQQDVAHCPPEPPPLFLGGGEGVRRTGEGGVRGEGRVKERNPALHSESFSVFSLPLFAWNAHPKKKPCPGSCGIET